MAPRRLKYCVNNEWKESKTRKYMPVTNSSTGEVMAEAPTCTVEEVNSAVAAAKAAFPGWSGKPIQQRTEVMFNFRKLLFDHLDELTLSVSKELGKNWDEAKGDILKVIEVVELACGGPILMQGDALMNVSTGHDTVMYREPVGVFAGIVPFNFPAMIPFGWMIPLCITMGNTFVLKSASLTPQTSMRCLELLIEAGMPKGVVNLVTCSRNEAELLLKHPDVRGISYVGSTSVGLHIYSTAAAHGKRVQALCEAKNHGAGDARCGPGAFRGRDHQLDLRLRGDALHGPAGALRRGGLRRRVHRLPAQVCQGRGRWAAPTIRRRSWGRWSPPSIKQSVIELDQQGGRRGRGTDPRRPQRRGPRLRKRPFCRSHHFRPCETGDERRRLRDLRSGDHHQAGEGLRGGAWRS